MTSAKGYYTSFDYIVSIMTNLGRKVEFEKVYYRTYNIEYHMAFFNLIDEDTFPMYTKLTNNYANFWQDDIEG